MGVDSLVAPEVEGVRSSMGLGACNKLYVFPRTAAVLVGKGEYTFMFDTYWQIQPCWRASLARATFMTW